MTKFFWPEYQVQAIATLVLLATVACIPSMATEPVDGDDQVSSRKVKPASPTAAMPASAQSPAPDKLISKSASSQSSGSNSSSSKQSDSGSPIAKSAEPIAKLELTASRSEELPLKGNEENKKKSATGDAPGDNALRMENKATKSSTAKTSDGVLDISVEAQQKKDQGECPGSEDVKDSKSAASKNLNDIPLEQDEHPFDAPAAESEHDAAPSNISAKLAKVEKQKATPLGTTPVDGAPVDGAASDAALEGRINLCLAHYYRNQENLGKRSPWAVMHTILPYGVETNIVAGNREVNAIGWMCYNGVCKTQRVFQSTNSGFRTNVGPGVQGHEGQFLAILAQSSVPRSFPIMVGKTRYTVSDLIRYEMVTCREKSELTFKLIGLSHYLSPQQTWRDDRGHTWNLEKLVREELDQPVVGAACGGTHRLMGLSYALMMRRRYNQPINNHWARADAYIQDFVQYAWTLQNPDGSFSTDWFEGRANEPNMERKVQTTGHILEWMIFTLPDAELNDPRISKSVEFLLSQIYDHRDKDWPIGPRGHSLRAISLYNQRYYGAPTGGLKSYLAQAGYLKNVR